VDAQGVDVDLQRAKGGRGERSRGQTALREEPTQGSRASVFTAHRLWAVQTDCVCGAYRVLPQSTPEYSLRVLPQSTPSEYSLRVLPQSTPSEYSLRVLPQSTPSEYSLSQVCRPARICCRG